MKQLALLLVLALPALIADAKKQQASPEPVSADSIRCADCPEMVFVQGGSFTLGCWNSARDGECFDDEKPPHEVTVRDFYIGKYEVTQAAWLREMDSNPSAFTDCDQCPVENVSWNDIQEYIKKLNARTGKMYCLPTEAEWEYAARGGHRSQGYRYSGGNTLAEVGWYESNSDKKTKLVGTRKANELGIYDMSGNVWEWVEDDWHENLSGAPTDGSAWRDKRTGSFRVVRGGGGFISAQFCRAASRHFNMPANRIYDLGFRLALPALISAPCFTTYRDAGVRLVQQKKYAAAIVKFGEAQNCTSDKPANGDAEIYALIADAKKQQSPPEPVPADSIRCDDCPEMVFVQGGQFIMGCQDSIRDGECTNNEKPSHLVTVRDFYIGKYEVTQAEWRRVMGAAPATFKDCEDCPVESVSWNDAQEFIKKLNTQTGKRYRLPTEAEWEYAARGGSRSQGYLYSGSNTLAGVGWYVDNAPVSTKPVGTRNANELGIYDMSGNVWEWVEDQWHSQFDGAPMDGRAWVDGGILFYRVRRGGGWGYPGEYGGYFRLAYRTGSPPPYLDAYIGFRLAHP